MMLLWVSATLDYDPFCRDWAALMVTDSLSYGVAVSFPMLAPSVVLEEGLSPSEVCAGPIVFSFVLCHLFVK